MSELHMTILMEPPSGNHYKKPRSFAGGISWYHTVVAKTWFREVAATADRQRKTPDDTMVPGKSHFVEYTVYQGAGSRGDVDNYAKCILDALTRSGVLRSDASVVDLICHKRRDRDNPRTEIFIKALT